MCKKKFCFTDPKWGTRPDWNWAIKTKTTLVTVTAVVTCGTEKRCQKPALHHKTADKS